MNTTKPKAIVLGGTTPHIALIENLRKRGYYVILVDYSSNPPAKIYADEHIKESTLNYELVHSIAEKEKVSLVISTCIDQANATACYVAEKLNLPKPYSFQTALNVTHKGLMKSIIVKNGIPTSPFFIVNNTENIPHIELNFPVVVKPVDSNGSKGVKKAENINELNLFLKDAISISRTKNAIIEKYIEGKEIQIDCFAYNKTSEIILIREKQKLSNKKGDVFQSSGSIIPANISSQAYKNIQQIATNIALAFKLNNTPFFIQAFVNGDTVNVIEFAPRVGGGLSYSIIKKITGFDIVDATIDSFLGNPVFPKIELSEYYYSTNIIYMKPGVFSHFIGYNELIEEDIIDEFYIQKPKGTIIDNEMASHNRIGAFLIKARTLRELSNKVAMAVSRLEVLDTSGNRVMRKELFNC